MAHFALLDETNTVTRVDLVEDHHCTDIHGKVVEDRGIAFLKSIYGENSNWKQTSYTGRIRKNFAGCGFSYDPSIDAFIPPKPHSSWILDQNTATWWAPKPKPDMEKWYEWNEETLDWIDKGVLFSEEDKLYLNSVIENED